MVIFENFAVALRALRANLMRSSLTMLGIIIGTAGVISVVSVVQGLEAMIVGQLQNIGTTLISVFPQNPNQGPGVVAKQVKLTWQDGQAIVNQVPGIAEVTPVVAGAAQLKYLDRQHTPQMVIGCFGNWPEVFNHAVERGRFFSSFDVQRRRKVAVVGREVVDELRLGNDPIGKEILVGNLRATVVGVMEERGQALGQNQDDFVFIPFDTALTVFGRNAGDQIQIRLQAENAEMVDSVVDGIKGVLRKRHKIVEGEDDDFVVFKQDQLISVFSQILGGVTAVIGAIAGVALLVGGIGIMNIMLVSVTERTREIGVRKAVGARRQDILMQFLVEAVVLCLTGGLIGVAVGYGIGYLVVSLVPADLPPPHVPIGWIAIAFGVVTVVGVVFGIYPAGRAASLDPIEALRYE
jgi:putative ABC transport system permease protein